MFDEQQVNPSAELQEAGSADWEEYEAIRSEQEPDPIAAFARAHEADFPRQSPFSGYQPTAAERALMDLALADWPQQRAA